MRINGRYFKRTADGVAHVRIIGKINDAGFVRANEVHRLCGDPAKLVACVGPLRQPALRETLMAMLANAVAGSAP